MDLRKQLTMYIEKKLGRIIDETLRNKIKEEGSSFDASEYACELFNKYFEESEIENIKREIIENCSQIDNNNNNNNNNNCDSDNSTEWDNYSHDSFELDAQEFPGLTGDAIIADLQNGIEEVQINRLKELEIYAEDLISQSSWTAVKKILRNLLEIKGDRKTSILTLKIFQKFLFYHNKPQMVCEAFGCLTELVSNHIELINSEEDESYFEEIYDLKENRWLRIKVPSDENKQKMVRKYSGDGEVLIKSMMLLLNCQKQMPEKWIRFSEKRLREIIFDFVHLLSSTTTSEHERLSGLELISVLNPTASWSRHWCHTAVGRSLLCSALRKYRQFFVRIVETLLANMKKRKHCQLPVISDANNTHRNSTNGSILRLVSINDSMDKENSGLEVNRKGKCVRSAPSGKVRGPIRKRSRFLVDLVPGKVATEAVFCHCLSLVAGLIQFRSGRSLFPIQTASRKRMLSVQDLVTSLVGYLEKFERVEEEEEEVMVEFTAAYVQHASEIRKTLKSVQNLMDRSRRSAERIPMSQR